jgi:hypothetical protein
MFRLLFLALLALTACQTTEERPQVQLEPAADPSQDDCAEKINAHTRSLMAKGFFPASGVELSRSGHLYYAFVKAQGDDPVFLYVVVSELDQDEMLLSRGFTVDLSCMLEGHQIYIYTIELDTDDQDGA